MQKYECEIAVIIPCYNEVKTVAKVITDYQNALPEARIFVIDNNSTDGTDKLAKENGATVLYEYKQGKGNAVKCAFRNIMADCYLMTDGDDTYPADRAKEMCQMILDKKADMVIGDRLSSTYFKENKRAFHNVGNKLVRKLINHIFKSNAKDVMTGSRALSNEFVRGLPILSKGFEIETEMTIHALDKNYKIIEIPVPYQDREEGSISKLKTFSDGMKVLKKIASLSEEYRPRAFFNFCALVPLLFSIFLIVPVLIEYAKTGLVPRFPSLIASGIFLVVSLLLWVCGIMIHNINKKHKELYELIMNQKN